MSRVKKAVNALKRRRKILKLAKGYRFGRSTKERQAKEALRRAGRNAYNHRRDKKGDFRTLWQIKINAFARENGTTYSKLMGDLKKKGIEVNRKVLSELAVQYPEAAKRVLAHAK